MAYRLTYTWTMSWVGPGMGQAGSPAVSAQRAGANAQSLTQVATAGGQNIVGTGSGGIIQAADISTLTTAAAADMVAQLEAAAPLAQMQGWPTGGN